MIAYGRLIGTRVEMSTLGETNKAQFFSEPESSALYRDSNCGICEPPIILSSYPLVGSVRNYPNLYLGVVDCRRRR